MTQTEFLVWVGWLIVLAALVTAAVECYRTMQREVTTAASTCALCLGTVRDGGDLLITRAGSALHCRACALAVRAVEGVRS